MKRNVRQSAIVDIAHIKMACKVYGHQEMYKKFQKI